MRREKGGYCFKEDRQVKIFLNFYSQIKGTASSNALGQGCAWSIRATLCVGRWGVGTWW